MDTRHPDPGCQPDPERFTQSGQAAGAPPVQPIVIRQSSGVISRLLIWCGWTGFVLCGILLIGQFFALHDYFDTSGGITERFHSGAKFGGKKVAILAVQGVIIESDGFVKRQIDRIRADQDVRAIVLRVDSPGGAVTASDYLYHHLKKLRQERKIPLVVSMGGMATSGGYYVAMAVGDQKDAIYAEPTTTTGSIGVIIPHFDLSGLLARFDIKDDSIATHPRKEMLSMTKPITDEQRRLLQTHIDDSFQRFKEVVRDGRPLFRRQRGALDELATGEIFTASQALENGLIDKIGFLEDALDRAMELAGLDKQETRIVSFRRPAALLELVGIAQSPRTTVDLPWLLELGAPRAYYLTATLAPLAASSRTSP